MYMYSNIDKRKHTRDQHPISETLRVLVIYLAFLNHTKLRLLIVDIHNSH